MTDATLCQLPLQVCAGHLDQIFWRDKWVGITAPGGFGQASAPEYRQGSPPLSLSSPLGLRIGRQAGGLLCELPREHSPSGGDESMDLKIKS